MDISFFPHFFFIVSLKIIIFEKQWDFDYENKRIVWTFNLKSSCKIMADNIVISEENQNLIQKA